MKAKGRRRPVAKTEPLALALFCGPAPRRLEGRITNPLVLGWNPCLSASAFSPTRNVNCSGGLGSGRSPKTGLVPTAILRSEPEESKIQNDACHSCRKPVEEGTMSSVEAPIGWPCRKKGSVSGLWYL